MINILKMANPFRYILICILFELPFLAKGQSNPIETIGQLVVYDNTFYDLIDKNEKIEVLAKGFKWAEGPVWVKNGSFLLFSDVPNNTVYKFQNDQGLSEFLKPSGYTGTGIYSQEPGSNGLTINQKGELISAEHGDRRISVMDFGTKAKTTLARFYKSKKLNSPNDVVQKSDGNYYFTDPPYGLPNWGAEPCPTKELAYNGVYGLIKNKLFLLDESLPKPNGLAFSPDEKLLYVAQSDPNAPHIYVYRVTKKGKLMDKRLFFDATDLIKQNLKGLPDGLKVDKKGNLFATGPGGVLVINPNGKLLGRIDTTQATANCTFGENGSVLYITANNRLCKIQTKTIGCGF